LWAALIATTLHANRHYSTATLYWYQAQRREGLTRESDVRRTEQRSAKEATSLRSHCSQLEAAARDTAAAAAAALSSARAEAEAAAAQAAAVDREVQALQQECAQCSAAAGEQARARTAAEVCLYASLCSVCVSMFCLYVLFVQDRRGATTVADDQ
jgi:hypothetical protein